MLKDLVMLAMLLAVCGCGCEPDAVPPIFAPAPTNPSLVVKTVIPPIPVAPPLLGTQRIRIDVMFVLDDSDQMNDTLLVPGDPSTPRRSHAVQEIMLTIRERIRARLVAAYGAPNVDAGTPPFDLGNVDFAFGVARFEDFGGPFTRERGIGPVDDPSNSNNDEDARPFILNMPILREAHPRFTTLFDEAIHREAPGDGNPGHPSVVPGFLVACPDPQTAIEALYQLATGSGFDGNGDDDTQDSGLPTSQAAARNPQTLPGDSGDVPAVRFKSLGTDADDQPLFQVQGIVDGVPTDVTIRGDPSIASGNVGGAGWRQDAVKFIVLASDIATVAPMDTAPLGPEDVYDPALDITLPPGPNQEITSTDGGVDAPRMADKVKTRAFDGGVVEVTSPRDVTHRRIGLPGVHVSPSNAHTIKDAIEALNALDIEVLLIGAPAIVGLSTKPGALGVNGDDESPIQAYDPSARVRTAFGPTSDIEPWLWMTAVSRLTTPEVTSELRPGILDTFPGVYNMDTVSPDTIADDLAERIRGWIDPQAVTGDANSPFKPPPAGGVVPFADRPPLPKATYDFRLELAAPSNPSVVQSNSPVLHVEAVAIPTYWSDQIAPLPVTVELPGDGIIGYTRLNDTVDLPAAGTVTFTTYAQFTGTFVYGGEDASDAVTEDKIRAAILARLGVDGARKLATDEIRVGSASYELTVRDTRDRLAVSSAIELIAAGAEGCAIIQETLPPREPPVPPEADEQAGTCPFPENP